MTRIASLTAWLALILLLAPHPAEAGAQPWLVTLHGNSGRFDTSDLDSSGSQHLVYTQVQYRTGDWGLGMTSSYASTSYQIDGKGGNYDLSGPTDTALTGWYRHRIGKANIRGGLDIGLPTGTQSQSITQLGNMLVDDLAQDLLLLRTYGGGLDVAAHGSLSYRTGRATFGLGLRYLVAGAYDPTTDQGGDEYDPGDSFTLVGSGMYLLSRSDSLLLTLVYTSHGTDSMGGDDVFKKGVSNRLELRYLKSWSATLNTSAAILFDRQDKNERFDGTALQSESGNANGNGIDGFLEMTYQLNGRVRLTGVTGYKTVDPNGYSLGDDLYDAGRSKWYLEPGGVYSFNESLMVSGKFRYSQVLDKADAQSPIDATYQVYNLDIGLTYQF